MRNARQLRNFCQLSVLEFDEIYSKQCYEHKDFSLWPNTEVIIKIELLIKHAGMQI